MRLPVGTRLGTYEVLGVLGAGGMGEVYHARDLRLGRAVALKVLGTSKAVDPASVRRLEEEARSASSLNHPNIVTIYGVGEEGEITYIAMELVQGRTLRDMFSGGAMTIADALEIASQIGEAIASAHEAGIVHRDLKPENVIVTAGGIAKVLDFGLARRARPSDHDLIGSEAATREGLTAEGAILGTVGYMSPEQASGRAATAQSDQFSLGVIVYEMLTGQRPFRGSTAVETLTAVIRDAPEPIHSLNAGVPEPLERFVDRCLAKKPEHRFPSTRALALQLHQIKALSTEAHMPTAVRPVDTVTTVRSVSRRRVLWAGAGVTAALVAGAGAWSFWPITPRTRSLAVLPFANGGGDADTDHLCEGITESLIQRVSVLPSLQVRARSTVFNFKGKNVDPQAAGRQLKVDSILTGTVTRRGNRLMVSTELIDVATGSRLWGNTYDRSASELMLVQDEIANSIVDEGFGLRPSGEERRRLAQRPTSDAEAYELYLRGRHTYLGGTEEDYLAARALQRQALARDPNFALAHVALASTYSLMVLDGYERPTTAWPEVRRGTSRALEIDPALADARAMLGSQAFFFDWDWDAAERSWRAAAATPIGVVEPELFRPWALMHWALGRAGEALLTIRKARAMDPLSLALRVSEADYLFHSGEVGAAVEVYAKCIQDEPGDPRAHFGLAEALHKQGKDDDAIAARVEAHRSIQDQSLDEVFARARGADGYRKIEVASARLQLESLMARAKEEAYVSPLEFARVHAQLREIEAAFKYFEPTFADRAPGLVFLNVDRSWAAIRNDPRFAAAVKRVGLPMVSSAL